MKSSDILVKQFKIEIPVYIGEGNKRRVDNLLDEELSSDIIRLYSLGKLSKVVIKKKYRNGRENKIYLYEIVSGNVVEYTPQELSAEIVVGIMNDRRGGARKGAGRNPIAGTNSVTVRVPHHLKNEIMAIIDMYVQLSSENKDNLLPIGRTTDVDRKKALEWMDMVVKYEHSRVDRLKEYKRKEEENRRQLKLFND